MYRLRNKRLQKIKEQTILTHLETILIAITLILITLIS